MQERDRHRDQAPDPWRLIRDKKAYRRGLGQDDPPPSQITTAPAPPSPWPAAQPINYSMPDHVPVRPQGDRPVIAHLVWTTHEELIPGRAIRWTPTHVMVMIKPVTGPTNQHELVVWLRAHDVYATIPRRPKTGPPPTV